MRARAFARRATWLIASGAALVLLALTPARTLAWGPAGRHAVASSAERLLAPETAREVHALLAADGSATLTDVASWADDIQRARPDTVAWHYVAIPLAAPGYAAARDCPEGACLVGQIDRFARVLADRRAAPPPRIEALKFLVALVGDAHQPLHCVDNYDHAGSDLKVRFFGKPTTLHAVWDAGIIGRLGPPDLLEPQLAATINPNDLQAWADSAPADWVGESHQLAQRVAYGLLPAGAYPALGQAYQAAAGEVVALQLKRAGVRLAALLNRALESAPRPGVTIAPATRAAPNRD